MVGTDNSETVAGTNSNDHITGKGGNDSLQGRARNAVYHFDDNFGEDTLTESAFVKVGKKKLPGGADTLNFSQYSGGRLDINIAPQDTGLDNLTWNAVREWGGSTRLVTLGSSPVENAVGGSGSDIIRGGSARNTYKGGPGGDDGFQDYGGAGDTFTPVPQAASDDTYKGFTAGTGGNDNVADWGGTKDVLDLRPLESSDVYFDAFDNDADGSDDSLRIVISSNATGITTSVTVIGHFAPAIPEQQNGRMEQIIFSDEVITSVTVMK